MASASPPEDVYNEHELMQASEIRTLMARSMLFFSPPFPRDGIHAGLRARKDGAKKFEEDVKGGAASSHQQKLSLKLRLHLDIAFSYPRLRLSDRVIFLPQVLLLSELIILKALFFVVGSFVEVSNMLVLEWQKPSTPSDRALISEILQPQKNMFQELLTKTQLHCATDENASTDPSLDEYLSEKQVCNYREFDGNF